MQYFDEKIYVVVEHINGEIQDLWAITGYDFAVYCLRCLGFIVFELDLSTLKIKEFKL